MSTVLSSSTAMPPSLTVQKKRLYSLDALRGFDMFWIMSGEHVIHALAKVTGWPILLWMSSQLHHTDWHGFTFYDMIFPLFLFIAGVSMPYSVGSKTSLDDSGKLIISSEQKKALYRTMIRRTITLIILGMVVNGLLKFNGYEETRFASVLGRIGLAWFFASLIYLNFGLRSQIIWVVAILLGYWAVMTLVPVPGFGAGNLSPEGAFSSYFDRLFLPGKLHNGVFDPEGLFSTIPSVATAMFGVFCGSFLHSGKRKLKDGQKGMIIFAAGCLFLLIGMAWGYIFPVNKRLWTSSFAMVAGGWSLILLAIFYLIIDVAGWKKWAIPFVWVGTNSILIYLLAEGMLNFSATAKFLFGGVVNWLPFDWQPSGTAISITLVQLILLWILYKRKIFLKI